MRVHISRTEVYSRREMRAGMGASNKMHHLIPRTDRPFPRRLSMMYHRSIFCACIALASLSASSAALAAYSVTDLTPTDLISPGSPLYDGASAATVLSNGGTGIQGGSGFYALASDSSHALLWNS